MTCHSKDLGQIFPYATAHRRAVLGGSGMRAAAQKRLRVQRMFAGTVRAQTSKRRAAHRQQGLVMYRLIASERVILEHARHGSLVSYRHRELKRFYGLPAAVRACDVAGRAKDVSCCVLDDAGQEYFAGAWIT